MKKWLVISLLACLPLSVYPAKPSPAVTKVDEFSDVKPTHWAYQALKELVEKYRSFADFPERRFRGEEMASRYDLALGLYGVLRYVDEKLAQESAPSEVPVIGMEDVRTLMRLQQEFRLELQKLGIRFNRLEQRLRKLERGLKISGEVEVAFRNRFTVADKAAAYGVLEPGPTSSYYTLFSSNNLNPFTHALRLKLQAVLDRTLRFDGQLRFLYSGASRSSPGTPVGPAGNHWFDETTTALPVFVEKSLLTWEAFDFTRDGVGVTLKVGLMNLDELVHPGTSFVNRFASDVWVGHGYGLVGFGAHKAAATDATCALFGGLGNLLGPRPGCATALTYTGHLVPRFWGSGIDASRVDPNSKPYNRLPSLAIGTAVTFMDKGALRLAAGLEQGPLGRFAPPGRFGVLLDSLYLEQFQDDLAPGFTDVTGRLWHDMEVFSGGTNLLPPSFYSDNYWVGEVTFDMRKLAAPVPLSMKANGMFYNHDPYFGYTNTRNEISAVFDFDFGRLIDPDPGNIGWTLQFNKSIRHSRLITIRPSVVSSAIIAEDFFRTGIGWGIGFKAAMQEFFNFSSSGRGDYSLGGYLWIPPFEPFPGMLLAIQQSYGPGIVPGTPAVLTATPPPGYYKFGFANAAGVTLQFPFRNIGGKPLDAVLELNSLFEGSLFDFRNVATDVAVIATYRF